MVLHTNYYLRHFVKEVLRRFFLVIYNEFELKITKWLFLLLELIKHSFIVCLHSQKTTRYIIYHSFRSTLYLLKKMFSLQAKLTELHYKENHSNRLKNKTNQTTYFLNHKQT